MNGDRKEHPLAGWLFSEMQNLRTWHHKLMARYLERHGWCVFYLEEPARTCNESWCWLRLYEQERKK